MPRTEQRRNRPYTRRGHAALRLPPWGYAALAAAVLLVIGASLFVGIALRKNTVDDSPYWVVCASSLNVRAEPDAEATAVGLLYLGEKVLVQAHQDRFVYVTTGHGLEGWCSEKYLKPQGRESARYLAQNRPKAAQFFYDNAAVAQALSALAQTYTHATLEEGGQSVWGQPIWMLTVGPVDAQHCIMVQGGIHAREYASAAVVVAMAEELLRNQTLPADTSVLFIPLLNPDGAALCQQGLEAAPEALREMLMQLNNGIDDFSRWKANGRGVDLNANFDARWAPNEKYPAPGSQGYRGDAAFSEPESVLIREITRARDVDMMACYHSFGQILYWYFGQAEPARSRDESLAAALGELCGYRAMPAQEPITSVAGSKDWFVQETGKPGFTIELFDSPLVPIDATNVQQEIPRHLQILPYLLDQLQFLPT